MSTTDQIVLVSIASFFAVIFLLRLAIYFIRNHPFRVIGFQYLHFASAKSGDSWKVVGLNETTLCIKRNGVGWTFRVNVESFKNAIELGQFSGGTLKKLPAVNESFCLGALEWMPERWRRYPVVPCEVLTKR